MLFLKSIFGFVFLASLSGSMALAENPAKFALVSEGIYRSAQPSAENLKTLKEQYGIKAILDINNDDESLAEEVVAANALGITVISQPMSGFWAPKDEQVNASLAILADPNNRPILIHCLHGEDRTGVIVALHRIFNEKIAAQTAYDEMLALGFHKILVPLHNYFLKKSGLN